MNEVYYKSDILIKEFEFLKDKGFEVIKTEDSNIGTSVEFSNNLIRIHLVFDFKDFFYYFDIIKGKDTKSINENYFENKRTFWDLALKQNPNFDIEKLKPNKEDGSIKALKENAELLKKCGSKILSGEEWF
jgi:hypothetical protein